MACQSISRNSIIEARNWEFVDNELLKDWLDAMLEEMPPPVAAGSPTPPFVSKDLTEIGFKICHLLGVGNGEVKYLAIHIMERFVNIMTAEEKKDNLIKIIDSDQKQQKDPVNEKSSNVSKKVISDVNELSKKRSSKQLKLKGVETKSNTIVNLKDKTSNLVNKIHGIGLHILYGVCIMLASKYLLEPIHQIRPQKLARILSSLDPLYSPAAEIIFNTELAVLTTLDYRFPATTAYSKLEILLLILSHKTIIKDLGIVFDTSTTVLDEIFPSRWNILCAVFEQIAGRLPSSPDEIKIVLKLDSDQLFLSSGIVISTAIILNLDWHQWHHLLSDISGWPKNQLLSISKIIMKKFLND